MTDGSKNPPDEKLEDTEPGRKRPRMLKSDTKLGPPPIPKRPDPPKRKPPAVPKWAISVKKPESDSRLVVLESPLSGVGMADAWIINRWFGLPCPKWIYKQLERKYRAQNKEYARACMRDCLRRGEHPYAGHLLFDQPGILNDEIPEERAKGIAADLAWGGAATRRVFYIDRGMSPGMLLGLEQAKRIKQPYEFRELKGSWHTEGVDPVRICNEYS